MMTKGFRLFVLSALVLAALGFSAIGAMALAPVTRTDLPTSSVTPEPKDEIGGTVTATEVTSTEPAGTVEPVDPKDSMSTPEPVETETARPDRNSSTDMNGSSPDKSTGNPGHDSGNGSGRDAGASNSSPDSHSGSGHDSGGSQSDATGNSGN